VCRVRICGVQVCRFAGVVYVFVSVWVGICGVQMCRFVGV
jgi:hypothetical protein